MSGVDDAARRASWARRLTMAVLVLATLATAPATGLSAEPASAAAPKDASAAPAPLTVKDFIAPATFSNFRLSPSGKLLAFVRTENEVDTLEVTDLDTRKAQIVLRTRAPGDKEKKAKLRQEISYLHWKTDNRLVVSVDAPVNFDAYGERLLVTAPIHLIISPDGQTQAVKINAKNAGKKSEVIELSSILDVLHDDPDHLLVLFRFNLDQLEVYKVDIRDGSRVLVERGDSDVVGFGVDRQGNIVTRTLEHSDGSVTVQGRAPGTTRWTKMFDVNRRSMKALSDWEILDYGGPGVLYVKGSPGNGEGGDTRAVHTYDLRTNTVGPVVWSHPKYDVEDVISSDDGELLAGCYWIDVYQCDFKDPTLAANLKGLGKYYQNKKSISIVSKSADGLKWVLDVSGADEPAFYVLYDVTDHTAEPLGHAWPGLSPETLGPMRRFDYKARDGADLVAYVTEPPHAPAGPLPLVVMPHGGPEARDHLEFDTWAQYLATRGYVVVQPNFRGSGGYGRKFTEAGYHNWGRLMHDDVTDAVKALIATGRVDPAHVCIVGASYGGYEALWSAHAEPGLYKCAVSVDGVADLAVALNWERRFGTDSSTYKYWVKTIGDPSADADRIAAASPARYAKTWTTPLLLIHGDKDGVVDVAQSRLMKRALEAEHKPVRYVEIKGMEHGPSTDEETTRVLTEIDAFLAPYLQPAAVVPAAAKPVDKPAAPKAP